MANRITRQTTLATSTALVDIQATPGVAGDANQNTSWPQIVTEICENSLAQAPENIENSGIKVLLNQILAGQKELASTMKAQIDDVKSSLKHVENSMATQIKQVYESVDKVRSDVEGHIQTMRLDVQVDLDALMGRMSEIEKSIHPPFKSDNTVVVINLPDDGETLDAKCSRLLTDGLGLADVPIMRTTRLKSRDTKPGIVKIELSSIADKVLLLRRKGNLASKQEFSRTFIRTSKPHTERVAENNFKTILDSWPDLKRQYRMAGHGRLVRNDARKGGEYRADQRDGQQNDQQEHRPTRPFAMKTQHAQDGSVRHSSPIGDPSAMYRLPSPLVQPTATPYHASQSLPIPYPGQHTASPQQPPMGVSNDVRLNNQLPNYPLFYQNSQR